MKPNQYWKCRCESWSWSLGWGHKSERDDAITNSVKAKSTLKYMKMLYKVMNFLFFRIKDFDLDQVK